MFLRSSRNIRFDSYWEKENPLFKFSVIKLGFVLTWTLLLDSFCHLLKIYVNMISGFLFMAAVNGNFLLFFYHTERERLSQRGHKNRHLKQVYFKWNSLTFSCYTKNLQFCKICFFHICSYNKCCFLCAASKMFLYIHRKVSEAFSGTVYFLSNMWLSFAIPKK